MCVPGDVAVTHCIATSADALDACDHADPTPSPDNRPLA